MYTVQSTMTLVKTERTVLCEQKFCLRSHWRCREESRSGQLSLLQQGHVHSAVCSCTEELVVTVYYSCFTTHFCVMYGLFLILSVNYGLHSDQGCLTTEKKKTYQPRKETVSVISCVCVCTRMCACVCVCV